MYARPRSSGAFASDGVRATATSCRSRSRPVASATADGRQSWPGAIRHACEPSLVTPNVPSASRGRGEPGPRDVGAVADPVDDHLARVPAVDRDVRPELEPRRRRRRRPGPCRSAARVASAVGPNREPFTSRLLTASSLTIAAAENALPVMSRSSSPSVPPARNRRRRDDPLTEAPSREADARVQARGPQGEQPRIGGLERRKERLRAAAGQLGDEAGERGHEQEHGEQADPGDRRERAIPPGDRRPAHREQRDERGPDRREADQRVDRPARPVAGDHQDERGDPQAAQDGPQDPQLDHPHTHVGQSTQRSASTRRTGTSRSSIRPMDRRRVRSTAPGRTTWDHRWRHNRTGPAPGDRSLLPPKRRSHIAEATPTSSRRRFGVSAVGCACGSPGDPTGHRLYTSAR